jgi:hypothetical protein
MTRLNVLRRLSVALHDARSVLRETSPVELARPAG